MWFLSLMLFLTADDVLLPDDAVEMETKDESEEPVDLIPTLVPLPPDEVCICIYYNKFSALSTYNRDCYPMITRMHLVCISLPS